MTGTNRQKHTLHMPLLVSLRREIKTSGLDLKVNSGELKVFNGERSNTEKS